MDNKELMIVNLLMSMYYLLGVVDVLDTDARANCTMALETMGNAERLIFGEEF